MDFLPMLMNAYEFQDHQWKPSEWMSGLSGLFFWCWYAVSPLAHSLSLPVELCPGNKCHQNLYPEGLVSPSLLVPLLPCLCYIYQHYSQHIVTGWSRWWMVKHAMMPALHAPPLWHSLASPHPNTPLSACLHVYSDYLFIYSGSGKNKYKYTGLPLLLLLGEAYKFVGNACGCIYFFSSSWYMCGFLVLNFIPFLYSTVASVQSCLCPTEWLQVWSKACCTNWLPFEYVYNN